jgi:hypothetical protein
MAEVTVDSTYLFSIFPELSAVPVAVINALNPVARFYVSASLFGDAAQYAMALIIAHFIKLDQLKGMGPTTSDRVGALATSFQALPTEQAMGMTSYGLRFLEFARMISAPILADGAGSNMPMAQPFSGPQPTWAARAPWSWGS